MNLKSITKILSLTSLSLLISSALLAEAKNKNCPNSVINSIDKIVEWEETSDGTKSPKIKYHKAFILNKGKKIDCQLTWIHPYGSMWNIRCNNGASIKATVGGGAAIVPRKSEGYGNIIVEDKNGNTYKMDRLNQESTTTCKENEVTIRLKETAYQKSFEFDIIIELIYQKKKTPSPAGF
mgnify:CR=1 FL=1